MVLLVPVLLVLLLTPSLTTSAALPQDGLSRLTTSNSREQSRTTEVSDSWISAKNEDSNHTKRVLPASQANPSVINTKECMETGLQLMKLMWADENDAERIYQQWTHKHGLKAPLLEANELKQYWSSQSSEQQWVTDFQAQDFQTAYRYICPHNMNVPGAHYFVTWVNDKSGAGKVTVDKEKHVTKAKLAFVMNIPAGIITIQEAQSPTALLKSAMPDLAQAQIEPMLPIPYHRSNVLFAAIRSEHGQHPYTVRWQNWGYGRRDLERLMGKLKEIIVARAAMRADMLQAVEQCVYQEMGPEEPGMQIGKIPAFPGVQFTAGSSCFYTILGTKPNTMIGWLLASHRDSPDYRRGLGHTILTGVRVFTTDAPNDNGQTPQLPTFVWSLAPYTAALEQKALAEQQKPFKNTFGVQLHRPPHELEEHDEHRGKNPARDTTEREII
ncbi:hypothetical protein LTR78_001653 [Recurvomyces mirabilis]|uniref:Uncharacterized protein n=1 Tax=Recurvomyces mirabilis TaxID=574656 RepID=A0AAE0WUC5_9PEZI|nr:hypothetical protein LTR78_001653 [Recurvomyces mirabilis]KAK5151777.1 hypothetical protein LTS14_008909 [Recurvomyces mirabilis]